MTIFTHKVPANLVGISTPAVPTVVNGAYAVQDVSRAIYAMQSNVPVKVGWIAAQGDGNSGIAQLARGMDGTYNWQYSTSGYGASGNSSSVTISFPSTTVLWNGSMQPIAGSSFTMASPGTGTMSFMVSYQWGLSQFSLQPLQNPTPLTNAVELCVVTITGTSATIAGARTNGNWMGKYWLASSPTTFYNGTSIPYSDANGNMSW